MLTPGPAAAGRAWLSPARLLLRLLVFAIFGVSLVLNLLLLFILFGLGDDRSSFHEHHVSGNPLAKNKIAVVHIDGVLLEGLTGFAQAELETAAQDDGVKAVVLRINSPGGSITASDDLYRRVKELRDGTSDKKRGPKTVVASFASVAASGAYYLAMPAQKLLAERTSISGSIGVYVALPNVTGLSEKIGFKMDVIRAGEVKDSGSPFRTLSPKERLLWQTMVDHAYQTFLEVVEEGRPALKGKLLEDVTIDSGVHFRHDDRDKPARYTRYRADGGIFTTDQALQFGLIDQLGYLDDAVRVAKELGGIGEDCHVISYDRPNSLWNMLLRLKSDSPPAQVDLSNFSGSALPRLWYLAPQAELAGLFAAGALQK